MSRYVFAEPPPFAHQRRGLEELIAHEGRYALLWEPGCGKTRAVLDYAGCLATGANAECRVLVVAPKSTQDSWLKEAMKYLPQQVGLWAKVLRGPIKDKIVQMSDMGPGWETAAVRVGDRDLLACGAAGVRVKRRAMAGEVLDRQRMGTPRVTIAIINLEAFGHADSLKDRLITAFKSFAPHILVVDESHRIKAPAGNASRLLRRVAPHVKRVILLTGTPMPHSPLDVWAQWAVLDPKAFKSAISGRPMSFGSFQDRYAELGGYMGKQVVGFQRMGELQDKIAPRSMVIRKEDALDLPPTTDVMIDIELAPAERRAYTDLKRDLLAVLASGQQVTVSSMLTQMLRLRQITSGFTKDDTGQIVRLGTSREDAAVSLIGDLLATERRIVVFAWARAEVDSLVARLGPVAASITGDTKDDERMAIRERFGDLKTTEKIVLVAQIRALSLGVNELVTASHALFLSLSQQRDDYLQARGRLDRPGQTKPVTYWHLAVPDSVDEIILTAHRNRSDLEAALLDHIRKA